MSGALGFARRRRAVGRDEGPGRPRRRPVSSLNDPVWRLAMLAAAGTVGAALVAWGLGTGLTASWIGSAAAGAGWLAAVRLLMLDSRWGRFWRAWIAGSVLLALIGRGATLPPAVALAWVFLLLRRYRPYRHLTSRRRAVLCVAAFTVFLLSLASNPFRPLDELAGGHAYGQSLLRYTLDALRVFWALTIVHLVLGMRLHFMRLKPKLITSAVFIAVVPLLLVLLLWIVILFSALGATRATSGREVLRDWAALAVREPTAGRALFGDAFRASADGTVEGTAPEWLPDLWSALATPRPEPLQPSPQSEATARPGAAERQEEPRWVFNLGEDGETDFPTGRHWAPVDSTVFLQVGPQLWVLDLRRGAAPPAWTAVGFRIDEAVLAHLARVLQADAGIYSGSGFVVGDADSPQVQAALADTGRTPLSLVGALPRPGAPADSTASFWRRPLNFGAAFLHVIRLAPAGLLHDTAVFHLKVAPGDLVRDIGSRQNEFNQVILLALVTLAILLLLIEAFAAFMGVRIATGITAAVRTLHQGTVRLARGDLDARIEVPNEDEFGDLADSFNEMTTAVKRGREEAVARERLERELRTAREIQERLLPHAMPELPGFEISGVSVPSLQVGGDYFDFLDLPDGRLGVAIADVSGKGIPAALLMANLQALLQGQVIHPGGVAEIVARVNDLLTRSIDRGRFATFFYGVLDPATGVLASTNAGHNPPLLRRADGRLEELKEGGLPIGMLEDQTYRQQSVTLEPGEVLVLYTDGITEAEGPAPAGASVAQGPVDGDDEAEEELPDFFGDERLRAILRGAAGLGAGEIRDAILDAVSLHAAGVPPSDDVTLVVIRRRA